jgi:hypothetical protein
VIENMERMGAAPPGRAARSEILAFLRAHAAARGRGSADGLALYSPPTETSTVYGTLFASFGAPVCSTSTKTSS